jgi:hypothetical protein
MKNKSGKEFQKIDYRPWNLVGLDQSVNNEDTKKVLDAKIENSSVNINSLINKAVAAGSCDVQKFDYFKAATLGYSPVNFESGFFPVSKYMKDCFNTQMDYLDSLRKISSEHFLNIRFKW